MSQPELMELVRLQAGDVLTKQNWLIEDVHVAYEPNQQLQVDAAGRLVKGTLKQIPRIKFRCMNGSWYGYLFPLTGAVVTINYNGAYETIQSTMSIDVVEMVMSRQVKESTPHTEPQVNAS